MVGCARKFWTNSEGGLTFYLLPEKNYSKKTKKKWIFTVDFSSNHRGEQCIFNHFPTSQFDKLFFKKRAIKFQGGFGGLWGLCELTVQSYSHLTGKIPQMGEMDTQELRKQINPAGGTCYENVKYAFSLLIKKPAIKLKNEIVLNT